MHQAKWLQSFYFLLMSFFVGVIAPANSLASEVITHRVSSTYTDLGHAESEQITYYGSGFSIAVVAGGQKRLFMVTNSHVSQGDISLQAENRNEITVGDSQLPILGRLADTGVSDIEIFEIDKTTYPSALFSLNLDDRNERAIWLKPDLPERIFLSPRSSAQNDTELSVGERQRVLSPMGSEYWRLILPTWREDQGAIHEFKNPLGLLDDESIKNLQPRASILLPHRDILLNARITGGISGSPIVTKTTLQTDRRFKLSGDSVATMIPREERYQLLCIAKSYHRLAYNSNCTPAQRLIVLLEQFISGKRGQLSPFVWKSYRGVTYREIPGSKGGPAFFKELSVNTSTAGGGLSGDGGGGLSGDGGGGLSSDGGGLTVIQNDRTLQSGTVINGQRVLGLAESLEPEKLLYPSILVLEFLLEKWGGVEALKNAINEGQVQLLGLSEIINSFWQKYPERILFNSDSQYLYSQPPQTDPERLGQITLLARAQSFTSYLPFGNSVELEFPAQRIEIHSDGRVSNLCEEASTRFFPFLQLNSTNEEKPLFWDLSSLFYKDLYENRARMRYGLRFRFLDTAANLQFDKQFIADEKNVELFDDSDAQDPTELQFPPKCNQL